MALAFPGAPGTGGHRGRGPAVPAANPRTIADFEEITAVPFVFARHPPCCEARVHMNSVYSDTFMDMADLFAATVPPTSTAFVADPVTIVKDKIQDNSVIPNAVDTTDQTVITPSWARCSFLISTGNRCSNRRLTAATLKDAMQCAIAHDVTHDLKIAVGIQALHWGKVESGTVANSARSILEVKRKKSLMSAVRKQAPGVETTLLNKSLEVGSSTVLEETSSR